MCHNCWNITLWMLGKLSIPFQSRLRVARSFHGHHGHFQISELLSTDSEREAYNLPTVVTVTLFMLLLWMLLLVPVLHHLIIPDTILCLSLRTTVTSARIPEKDAYYRPCSMCIFSHVQKRIPRLTRKGCVLQRYSLCRTQWRHGCSWDETKYR